MARFGNRLKTVLQTLTARFRKPAMIGTPPSARQIPADPAWHALDFSRRYAEDIDLAVSQRMMELGIPDNQIGRPDADRGGRWYAFFPHQRNGGGVVGNKINVDAGLFDTDLMTRKYGPEIGKRWENDRLRDRLDEIIAHEYAETSGISHDEAVQRAAETRLPIRDTARERLRAMAEAEKRDKGR